MIAFFLLFIAGLSVAGILYIYKKEADEEYTKKAIAILLAIVISLSAVFMIFDAQTRSIALATNEQNDLTLAILLGWNYGGYSPYVQESWGNTGPNDDFDWDGIKNSLDADADGDGVEDYFEQPTRFNPFQPDIGIQNIGFQWIDENTIRIEAEPVQDITGIDFTVTLFVNNILKDQKSYSYNTNIDFTVDVDPTINNVIELHSEGKESNYANKANNMISYTIPSGVMGAFGQWYFDLENQIGGIIRNSPLFQSATAMSGIESLFRSSIAGLPLFVWFIIIILLVIVSFWLMWRKKKGKPSLFKKLREKKKKHTPGTVVVRSY